MVYEILVCELQESLLLNIKDFPLFVKYYDLLFNYYLVGFYRKF